MRPPEQIIKRPLLTEKGTRLKETGGSADSEASPEATKPQLLFEVARDANKTEVKTAVEKIFKVKVEEVRTANFDGKMRRRGRFMGYRPEWKKAYVRLKGGQKVPDFTDI